MSSLGDYDGPPAAVRMKGEIDEARASLIDAIAEIDGTRAHLADLSLNQLTKIAASRLRGERPVRRAS